MWQGKMGFAAKEALIALQRSLVCNASKAYLCVKQALFAMQVSLVCGAETAFLRQNGTLIFAQKRLHLSNSMAVSRLRLHAVFCKIPTGFPFLHKRLDFWAVRNANIRQARLMLSGGDARPPAANQIGMSEPFNHI